MDMDLGIGIRIKAYHTIEAWQQRGSRLISMSASFSDVTCLLFVVLFHCR
jgi:hypothetical protein